MTAPRLLSEERLEQIRESTDDEFILVVSANTASDLLAHIAALEKRLQAADALAQDVEDYEGGLPKSIRKHAHAYRATAEQEDENE